MTVSISEVKASNRRISQDTAPQTAVFTGATDGIGKASLARLVSTKLPIRIYVIGRNGEKHKPFLDQLRASNGKADIIWLEGQVSLLADTKRLCETIKEREKSLDILYTSPGFLTRGERTETSEGLPATLALSFYNRLSMMIQLLPLLNASTNNPRVVNVLAAGTESSSLPLDDLELKKPGNFSLMNSSRTSVVSTTLSMLRLAKENPHVIFLHHYPGGVNTGLFEKAFGDKWFFGAAGLILSLAATTPEDAGEKVVYLMTSAKYGGQGVPLGAKLKPGLTMNKTRQGGSLFLVNDKLHELQQEKVMAELDRLKAGEIIWGKLQERMAQFS
ncbi:unnamed protein product [Clonostachys chloroleuca]|uniref:NAD(P)-binding protein n=1 Tax=Clonostachys chloroleuca TaxID=1926264 RepID=A0AA35ME67_9HYPO|nr:unnamed protein product [Clonostachys chloroleuca]